MGSCTGKEQRTGKEQPARPRLELVLELWDGSQLALSVPGLADGLALQQESCTALGLDPRQADRIELWFADNRLGPEQRLDQLGLRAGALVRCPVDLDRLRAGLATAERISLHQAAREGRLAELETVCTWARYRLAERDEVGPSPGRARAGWQRGMTALHWAARSGQLAAAEVMLGAGAAVQPRDKYGSSPLDWASANGHAAIAGLLIGAGAGVNSAGTVRGRPGRLSQSQNQRRTALHWASANGHTEVVGVLLEAGARVNAMTKGLETPLVLAIKGQHEDVIEKLTLAGGRVPPKFRLGTGAFRIV